MRDPYAVLQPLLDGSGDALVKSRHATLEAAMDEQRSLARSYGWAFAEVRELKRDATVGARISMRSHRLSYTSRNALLAAGMATCGHCDEPVAEGESMHVVCRATAEGE
jgi:hypothetical protein